MPVYHYDEQALNLLATLFSPGFIHLGSKAWVESLGQEFDLTGKKVLDFGSGAGGPVCYLARNEVQITGVEVSDFLLAKSKALATQLNLSGRVEFLPLIGETLPAHNKFDLIMSINGLSRYKDKNHWFVEFNRMLRGSGTLMLMDWFHKTEDYSAQMQAFLQFSDEIVYLASAQDYLQLLEKNKFNYVNFKDTTKLMRSQCDETILLMKTEHQETLVTHFGAEYYEWWLEYWQLLYAALQTGDLITGYVRGVKS